MHGQNRTLPSTPIDVGEDHQIGAAGDLISNITSIQKVKPGSGSVHYMPIQGHLFSYSGTVTTIPKIQIRGAASSPELVALAIAARSPGSRAYHR
jgi:hypothetical protein